MMMIRISSERAGAEFAETATEPPMSMRCTIDPNRKQAQRKDRSLA
jgi:hypothetical protein